MLPSIYRKPLSTSATTSPHKKTNFSQHERHLPEKLSSRNFSSSLKVKGPEKLSSRNFSFSLKVKGPEKLSRRNFSSCLKLKGPQHSQDGEWDASSISISECDAREIGNFDQRHRKGHKISIISQGAKSSGHSVIHLDNRFPQIVPQRQTKNRQQLYVTIESEKNKLETDEKKLDNNHDDPVCMGNKNWYKVLWRELKKQAKRIVNSEADADSSFDETMSIDTCVTRRHSDSRSKLNKHFLPNENLAFPEDVEVKIESWDRVTFHKVTPSVQTYMILESDIVDNNPPTPVVSSHVSIPDQSNIKPVQVKKKFPKMSNSTHPEGRDATRLMPEQKLSKLSDDWDTLANLKLLVDITTSSDKTGEEPIEDSLTHFKLPYEIASLHVKKGEKLKENNVTSEMGYCACMQIPTNIGQYYMDSYFTKVSQTSFADKVINIASWNNVTLEMGYFACMQIPTNKGQYYMDSYFTKVSQTSFTDKVINIASWNNVTLEMGYFACMQIPTNKGQYYMDSYFTKVSQTSFADKVINIASWNNVTLEMGYFACMQIPTNKGQYYMDSYFTKVSQTSFADKVINIASWNNVTLEMGYFACMQIPTNKGQYYMDSYFTKVSQTSFADKVINIASWNNVTLEMGYFACMQIPTNKGQYYMDSYFTKVSQTSFADKVINIASWLTTDGEMKGQLVAKEMYNTFKVMLPASSERREEAKDGKEQLVAKAASSNTLKEILFASRDGREQLVAKATSSNTLKEILFASRDGREQLVAKATSSTTLKEILKNVSAGERSKKESTPVKLYRNVMQNETCRMMTGIDVVVSEAKRLFGNERTQIFFDLLGDELFCFGLSGAAPGFIPNMTQSTVRQHVISFFEHSCDTINRLMTFLLGCPDSKILQQMPEQHFISLMRSVIDSSLKAKTKGGKILSLKESTFIMVDSEEFERALGENIPEDVLNKLRHGEEVVAQKFVDTKIGITQASEGRENSRIHFIYFPSDCHLFIYIPTEKGSYWHQVNVQRENRIRRHNK